VGVYGGDNEQHNETNEYWGWQEAQYAGGLDKSLMLDEWNAPPTAGKLHIASAGAWKWLVGCITVLCGGSMRRRQ
jgi:hypothetical protein